MKTLLKNIFRYLVQAILIATISGVFAYGFFVVYRVNKLYAYVKSPHRGWEGNVHQSDNTLGYKPKHGTKGAETFADGKTIPSIYDELGFRVQVGAEKQDYTKRPLFLFLGDSFTYGSACLARETFPFLVGGFFKGTTLNAGVISYSFSQMVILARELIPEYKPDYVIVQVSPWLTTRAMEMFRPAKYVDLPIPYIVSTSGGSEVVQPAFVSNIFNLPISSYKNRNKGFFDYLSFLKNVGIPFFVYDDYHRLLTGIQLKLNIIPTPENNRSSVEKYAYQEIYRLCKKNGCIMVLVILGDKEVSARYSRITDKNRDIIIVNAEAALWGKLPQKTKDEYEKAYKHWQGNPPVIIDHHPNPKAHMIIAKEICKYIIQHK